jgi:hypothetical protein
LPASPPDPNIKEQRGCFVKTTGDNLLLGSASLIDALGIFRRWHESVIKLTLGARRSAYYAHG